MENLSKDKKSLILNKPTQLKVSANKFVDQVKINKLESKASDIKMKLLEMRLKSSEKKVLTSHEFNVLIEHKSFSFSYRNKQNDIEYAFKPEKFLTILENIPNNLTKNNIKDNLNSDLPISKKIADLQEIIGLKEINGIFDYNTFNSLIEKYLEKILQNDKSYMNVFDKILLLIVQLIGENNFSSYIKGLLLSYSYLVSIESGKLKDSTKMDLLLDKYLTSFVKPKIKNRIRIHKLLYEALDFGVPENLNFLVEKEINNLTINDKILLIKEYINESIIIDQNTNNIVKILNSINKKNIDNQILIELNELKSKLENKLSITI